MMLAHGITQKKKLKRLNEIKQDLKEGKRMPSVRDNTLYLDGYSDKSKQVESLDKEIRYLEIPRGLREKYPKVDKWLMGVLDNYTRKPEVFKERFGDVESFF